MGKILAFLYGAWCVAKYASTVPRHFGYELSTQDAIVMYLAGDMTMGAAASLLWPVLAASVVLDIAIVASLANGAGSAAGPIVGQLLLGLFVMYLEPFVLGSLSGMFNVLVVGGAIEAVASHATIWSGLKGALVLKVWLLGSLALYVADKLAEWTS